MDFKKILVTMAISAATCILLDFVLPLKLDEESGRFTRINF